MPNSSELSSRRIFLRFFGASTWRTVWLALPSAPSPRKLPNVLPETDAVFLRSVVFYVVPELVDFRATGGLSCGRSAVYSDASSFKE